MSIDRNLLEPQAAEQQDLDAVTLAYSSAISLKRIADTLEFGMSLQVLIDEIRAMQTYGIKVQKP